MEPLYLYQIKDREVIVTGKNVTQWEIRIANAKGTAREVRKHLTLVNGKDLRINGTSSKIEGLRLRYVDKAGNASAWATLMTASKFTVDCFLFLGFVAIV